MRPFAVLYVLCVAPRPEISAWRPPVAGVVEVFHAHFTEHAYPMHVHDAWTLLIVDDGAVRYDLDRYERGTPGDTVSLLPPQVPHNGSSATPHGFRKRVLYLDMTQLDERFIELRRWTARTSPIPCCAAASHSAHGARAPG